MTATPTETSELTPLHALHLRLGARMAPFAGYDMPIQYPTGVLTEHLHTREKCGLFDVSHMGQAVLEGPNAAARLETLVPADIVGLAPGRTRYTQFLADDGGILDDLMVTRLPGEPESLYIVCNASMKAQDFALMREKLPDLRLDVLEDRALIAVQGPRAADVVEGLIPGAQNLVFMQGGDFEWRDSPLFVTRSGYTGEDGFEISLPASQAEAFAERLLAHPDCKPIGLGARDSLRLEAGLCLYGHDIDTSTDPIEAALQWSIGKRRRENGGFPGVARIQHALKDGAARVRIGLVLEGKQPAREGAEIATPGGEIVGKITSGGPAPSLGKPVAMGYVAREFSAAGTELAAIVRGKALPARVTKTPFVPNRYFKG
ncbi:MAG: glycine cleavage system aminomethyltransferase GcvT [Hyphomicrobiales bacterium]|nr:glycine cleavage system aminomethyltransferase GcvT [Hyphomicrobiales bacterium]